jgi:hypothetical protein
MMSQASLAAELSHHAATAAQAVAEQSDVAMAGMNPPIPALLPVQFSWIVVKMQSADGASLASWRL